MWRMLKLCGKNSSVALKYDIPCTYWRFSRRESSTRLKRDKEEDEKEGERAILENGRRGIKRVSDEKVEQVEREDEV